MFKLIDDLKRISIEFYYDGDTLMSQATDIENNFKKMEPIKLDEQFEVIISRMLNNGWKIEINENPQELPMQPICFDERGTARFKANSLVRHLIDKGSINMNDLAIVPATAEEREQFAQLIGYSVSGFGDLSYVREETIIKADRIVDNLVKETKNES